jgi:hypothetical protein
VTSDVDMAAKTQRHEENQRGFVSS